MCVIIYKPAGITMPSLTTLLAAQTANPHGCGFATPSSFFKGLDFDQFYSRLQSVKTSEHCIIHFRLATHGSIKRTNCHPFRACGVSFAHNGVLTIEPVGDRTDSETAFLKYILPAIKKWGWDSVQVNRIINSLIGGSKFALMFHDDVRLFGQYTLMKDGCYYSNTRFLSFMDRCRDYKR